MTLQTKIKADIVLTITIIFSFIFFIGFMYGMVDKTTEYEQFVNIVTFCLFPFVLLYDYFNLHDPYLLFIFLGLSILLYSYLFIRFFSKKLRNMQIYKPYILTHITAYVIPAIVLIRIVYVIVIIE